MAGRTCRGRCPERRAGARWQRCCADCASAACRPDRRGCAVLDGYLAPSLYLLLRLLLACSIRYDCKRKRWLGNRHPPGRNIFGCTCRLMPRVTSKRGAGIGLSPATTGADASGATGHPQGTRTSPSHRTLLLPATKPTIAATTVEYVEQFSVGSHGSLLTMVSLVSYAPKSVLM